MKYIRFVVYSLFLINFTACQAAAGRPADSVPVLIVQEATNCRTGPGTDHDIVFTYPAGTRLQIVSRDEPANFWLVKSDESPIGLCWMWGGSVEVTGNLQAVPGVTPAAPTRGPSETLIVDRWEYDCGSELGTFTLHWRDRATNETGYRIFRNGQLLIELPAGSTVYTDTFALTEDRSVEYYLQAYGNDWIMNSSVMTAEC